MKQRFCRFLKNVEVWQPRYPFKSCFLRPGLSIGGNDMVTQRFKHFLLKETHIFFQFCEKWRENGQEKYLRFVKSRKMASLSTLKPSTEKSKSDIEKLKAFQGGHSILYPSQKELGSYLSPLGLWRPIEHSAVWCVFKAVEVSTDRT